MAPRDDKPLISYHDGSSMPDPMFYSHSVSLSQASRLVFTSGIIAQRPDGTFPETLEEQTKAVYDNLKNVLKNSGATPRDLIKVTFYPVDWSFTQAETLFKLFFEFVTDDYGIQYRPITTLIPVTQLAFPGPKLEIEVVAATGGHATAYVNPSIQSFKRPVPPLKVDVVVVGGGFSGVQAAWDLHKAGLSTILLEAKHRLGGRSRTHQLQSGPGLVELGATWINEKTQPKAFATAKRLNLELVGQYVEGDEIWQLRDGSVLRTTPGSEAAELVTNLNGALYQAFQSDMDSVNIHKPTKIAANLDTSLEKWGESKGLVDETARDALKFFSTAVVGRAPHEIGSHYFLDYIKSGGGFISIASEGLDGAQSLKVKQGTSAIATGLADELPPGSVFVNSPVDSIHQTVDGAFVETAMGNRIFARKVVVAIPTNTYEQIRFSPPLPSAKRALVSRTKPGVYAKMIVTYSKAWWKDLGLQGKFTSMKGPICFSWEISDDSKKQYSLALFIAGGVAAKWSELNELQREESVINHLAELVGPENASLARDILEVNYVNWTEEPYLGGAPTSSMGPGLLSKYGDSLRQPFQHIHFAGSETAYEWKGYLEGALLAGSRAAAEVISLTKRVEKQGTLKGKL
ncbi:uncharacterized protein A1O9_00483 [Exophiala aquamarina CBS 119918]|uniref:Amine oxidase n=1 Tax=Exophiala aquamarina CBS 119918 TaxID=1182545 RepID=A0A072Q3M6_9EURO|nr:uncharacterized protein A1O9_00483 [Exophiala aquamarina CBS 119918]KEF62510.1 hypothetical protein A1O9_00483 [Exophiala aquamarina CBS 119918]